MKRVLSGVRPTGIIHLGNYLGAIQQWVKSLEASPPSTDHLFCIVDLHALTTLDATDNLKSQSYLMAATYLACGLDPKKCHIFRQSHVAGHSELSWLLSCITPMGWLNRMTQFKEKSEDKHDSVCLGLYAYPVLMAADILLYDTTHVPVGDDQKQHVELARDVAGLFNRRFDNDCFMLPEPVIQGASTRVMSLRDGTKKMSKSDVSDYSRIHLNDDADTIVKKIKKAKTDSDVLGDSLESMSHRPEAKNLIHMLASLTDATPKKICDDFKGESFSVLKKALMDALCATIGPIQEKIDGYLKDVAYLDQVLKHGADYANDLAAQKMAQVRQVMGL